MKKVFLLTLLALTALTAESKKVKFSVDMTGQVISVNGIHVGGDFQVLAGYPADFESGTTELTREGTSDIYSIVVDIPAFAKYEYKFINGNQWYEAEFVPYESRVIYNFNDNRWIYVDSIADDTTDIGAVIFADNAPANLNLVRFYVDMINNPPIDPQGVYVTYSTGSGMESLRLYNFDNSNYIYEIIGFTNANPVEYVFRSGTLSESLPSACNFNGYRNINVSSDSLLYTVCFNDCVGCITGIVQNKAIKLELYPNPVTDHVSIQSDLTVTDSKVVITDITGRKVKELIVSSPIKIETGDLVEGVYTVHMIQNAQYFTGRFIKK